MPSRGSHVPLPHLLRPLHRPPSAIRHSALWLRMPLPLPLQHRPRTRVNARPGPTTLMLTCRRRPSRPTPPRPRLPHPRRPRRRPAGPRFPQFSPAVPRRPRPRPPHLSQPSPSPLRPRRLSPTHPQPLRSWHRSHRARDDRARLHRNPTSVATENPPLTMNARGLHSMGSPAPPTLANPRTHPPVRRRPLRSRQLPHMAPRRRLALALPKSAGCRRSSVLSLLPRGSLRRRLLLSR